MASTPAIPPFNKIFLVGIWVETALWGVNTVVFAGVCYVLFCRPNAPYTRWVLGVTSLLLYLTVTLHISAALSQELQAFINVPPGSPPEYASIYFANEGAGLATMKNSLYTTAVFLQDLILIWRMYVVWGRNWKIILLPLTIELVHIGCAYAAVILLTKPNAGIYTPILTTFGNLGWPLELVVNVCVTGAIASRLWYMGRKVSRAGSSSTTTVLGRNSYAAPIFTIIESGAILIAVTITMLTLYKTGNPAALMCTDIATQIAALVPYLIIVRVGLGLTHGLPSAYKSYMETTYTRSGATESSGGMTFAPNRLFAKAGGRSQTTDLAISKTVSTTRSNDISMSDFEAAVGRSSQDTMKRYNSAV